MKTTETMIRTYMVQELYERYPDRDVLAPLDLSNPYHETAAQADRKKRKQNAQECASERQFHKEPAEAGLPSETPSLVKKLTSPQKEDSERSKEEKITDQKAKRLEKSRAYHDANREKINARKRTQHAAKKAG